MRLTRGEASELYGAAYDFLNSDLWAAIKADLAEKLAAHERTLHTSADLAEIRYTQGIITGAGLFESTMVNFARYVKKQLGDIEPD